NIAGTFCSEDLEDWQIPDWDESLVTEPYPQAAVAEKVGRVQEIMWDSAGIIRTEEGLTQGWESLSLMRIEVERIYRRAKVSDDLVGLRNMIGCGLLVIEHARRNRQSRGCHFRRDTQAELTAPLGPGAERSN